jgi:predicted ester cyclase
VDRPEGVRLWERWLGVWNGGLDDLEGVVHPDFEFHRTPPPQLPPDARGREALRAWILQTRALISDLRFTVVAGPIVDGELVAGRWVAEGTYGGGIPGGTVPLGTTIRFHGNDIWRAEGGLVREYWLSDDLLDLLRQVGAMPAG